MRNILIRNVDDQLDQALRIRAVQHQRTREAEIKAILENAVGLTSTKKSMVEALMAIPKAENLAAMTEARASISARDNDFGI